MLITLSLTLAIPLKAPWTVSAADSKYLHIVPSLEGTYCPSATVLHTSSVCIGLQITAEFTLTPCVLCLEATCFPC